MKKWDNVRREWIMVEHKGVQRRVKLYQYIGALVKQMPKTRVGHTEELVDHRQNLKDAYCAGGAPQMNAYIEKVYKDDYIRKCGYFWDILSQETREHLQKYFNINDVLQHPIDILLTVDLDKLAKVEGVGEITIVETQSMINHIQHGKK